MKIAHISDLHFCVPNLKNKLEKFQQLIMDEYKFDLGIEFCDKEKKDDLIKFIEKEKPHALVITGDITTFGDVESYKEATKWINKIVNSNGVKKCLIVPGNHDALKFQLECLIKKRFKSIRWYYKRFIRIMHGKLLLQIEDILSSSGKESESLFTNFNKFIEELKSVSSEEIILDLEGDSKVILLGFNSVSNDPIWMNVGTQRRDEIKKLYRMLETEEVSGKGKLRILCMHHNPISSPKEKKVNLKYAYNSMPDGVLVLKTIQEKGVDIVLYGHDHSEAIFCYDLNLNHTGHAFGIASPSSTHPKTSGLNIIEIEDINHVNVTACIHENNEFKRDDKKLHELCLERNRPTDTITNTTRFEVKKYRHGFKSDVVFWEDLLKEGAELIYWSGRRFKKAKEDDFKDVRKLIEKGTKIRMLIYNDELLQEILLTVSKGKFRNIWGSKENFEAMVSYAKGAKKEILEFYNSLSKKEKGKIDIRMSHTILPFTGLARNPDKKWGKIGVRILPVGGMGDVTIGELRLNCRKEEALYNFYIRYFKYLINKAADTKLTDTWAFDNEDLK